jgi:protein disulfide-isomerase A1
VYQELAKKLLPNKNVVIANIDWTVNKVDGVDIRGYPTVRFYKKGGETPEIIDYNDARTVEAFEKFLENNTRYKQF